jgi:hypothetical protein
VGRSRQCDDPLDRRTVDGIVLKLMAIDDKLELVVAILREEDDEEEEDDA